MLNLCRNYSECQGNAVEGSGFCAECKELFREFCASISKIGLTSQDRLFLFAHRNSGCRRDELSTYLKVENLDHFWAYMPDECRRENILPINVAANVCYWNRHGIPDVERLLKEMLGERTLPDHVVKLLKSHPKKLKLTVLEGLLGISGLHRLAKNGRLKAFMVYHSQKKRSKSRKPVWCVGPAEAILICDKAINWISAHQAAVKVQEERTGKRFDPDTLVFYARLGELGPTGTDIFGRFAILTDRLPTLANDYWKIQHRRRSVGCKRPGRYTDGSLSPETIHKILPTIRYKTILIYFGKGYVPGDKIGGWWLTDEERFRAFLEKAAAGEFSGKTKIIARNIAIFTNYLREIESINI